VTTPEAIYEASLSWHAERLASLEVSAAPVSSTEHHGVEALSWAISTLHRISQEIHQVYAEIVPKIVNRLRNFLYESTLTGYYFGGLFPAVETRFHLNFGRRWTPTASWSRAVIFRSADLERFI
jgi:hypothetical protein